MRLAWKTGAVGTPGTLHWQKVGDGFEAGELPVLVEGQQVDRLMLARIDPHRYRFVVLNAPAGTTKLADWMSRLQPALVINGSYFSLHGTPDTPFLSDGQQIGPADYKAREGAFVASPISGPGTATIRDLAHEDWRTAFQGARNALVSYPLLVGGTSVEHTIAATDWLANRSFVGEDRDGRILLGTTEDAFFSLARFSAFLKASPLELSKALNLDGGPVACQGIAIGTFKRNLCGRWEVQKTGDDIKLLTWLYGSYGLPIVLAALPNPRP